MNKFMHFRLLSDAIISPMGGATVAYTEESGYLIAAVAYCNPKDNFNYKYGRNKAQGRLTQLMNNKELDDGDTYFILPSAEGLAVISDYMAIMGYSHRGPRK